jgi:FixJ family two-component response regulator
MSNSRSSVLVVEDDPAMREALNNLLAVSGFRSCLAGSAEHALQHSRPYHHDCLIVDIDLPGISGLELIEQLSTEHRRLPQRVIFVSALESRDVQTAAEQLGARAFLLKPFSGYRLVELVRQVVDAAEAGADGPEQESAR